MVGAYYLISDILLLVFWYVCTGFNKNKMSPSFQNESYNNCAYFLETPFHSCSSMDRATNNKSNKMCHLILNSSTVFMEKNCEFEWSCENGSVLHKRVKSSRNFESKAGCSKAPNILKLTRYSKPPLIILQENLEEEEQKVKYGELIILGYNGSLPKGNRRRRRSKFVLYTRKNANGVKRSKDYAVKNPQSSQAIRDAKQHAISYVVSKNHAVVVEYITDYETDMFQIGRSSGASIDFVVLDTIPGNKSEETRPEQCKISRFACRILADRNTNRCRIYAAGFDHLNNIHLGEKAPKWQENNRDIDGLTTNGVLLMHPNGSFSSDEVTCGYNWWEVSVTGKILSRRESRSSQERGQLLEGKTNILQDGTLIDLSGATLLWRSAEGLTRSPSQSNLKQQIDEMGPPYLTSPTGFDDDNNQQPYLCLNCGRVQNVCEWEQREESEDTKCPLCLKLGFIVEACLGVETTFYLDCGPPTFAFNPCGHMATEKTVKYWAGTSIPHGTNGYRAICPFCSIPLAGSPGYVRLIFQDSVG